LLTGREWALAWMYTLVTGGVAGIGMAISTWYFSTSPTSFFLDLPEPLRSLFIWEIVFRLGAFGLGCLWIRTRWIRTKSTPELPEPVRNPCARRPGASPP
jgi:hypothetical protein